MSMNGKLIVFEGTDGSGKSTQFQKLCDRLDRMGRSYQRLVFPQYDQPSSALIRMYPVSYTHLDVYKRQL